MSYRQRILKIMREFDDRLRKEGRKVMHSEILYAEQKEENKNEKLKNE